MNEHTNGRRERKLYISQHNCLEHSYLLFPKTALARSCRRMLVLPFARRLVILGPNELKACTFLGSHVK